MDDRYLAPRLLNRFYSNHRDLHVILITYLIPTLIALYNHHHVISIHYTFSSALIASTTFTNVSLPKYYRIVTP